MNKQWFLIENDTEHQEALTRYEQLKLATKGSVAHKEKMLLSQLISLYEASNNPLPEVDPIELIKIRMKDFGYKSTDLAKEYGDRGTVSKVLNYKQALSITMIRKFSKMLQVPAELLLKEYKLKI